MSLFRTANKQFSLSCVSAFYFFCNKKSCHIFTALFAFSCCLTEAIAKEARVPIATAQKAEQQSAMLIPSNALQLDLPFTPHIATSSTVAPITEITSSQIDASNKRGQTLSQLLAFDAGLQTIDAYGNGSRMMIDMRGFGDDAAGNTLVLVDGIPYVNPDISSVNLNFLPLNEIERIEIIPGSAGVLYGDQAVGGVINVVTKRPQPDEVAVQVAAGNLNAHQIGVVLGNVWHEHWGVRVSAVQDAQDNYRHHNYDQNNVFNALLNYHDDTTEINLNYRKNNQHFEMPGALTKQQLEKNPRQAISNIPFFNDDSDWWQLNLKRRLTEQWQAEANAATRYKDGIGALTYGGQAVTIKDAQRADFLQLKVHGADKPDFYPFPISAIVGADFAKSHYTLDAFGKATSYKSDDAVYGQVGVPLAQRLTMLIGARTAHAFYTINLPQYDGQSGQQQSFSPVNHATATDIEFSWRASDALRYFVRRAASFRFPKVDEETYTLTGKPLQPQTGISYEGGVVYDNKSRLKIATTLYQLDLNNQIANVPIATAHYFSYNTNLDPTRHIGASADARFAVTPQWLVDANYDFVDAKFREGMYASKRVPFVAQHNMHTALTYKFDEHWYAKLSGNFTGRRYPVDDVENRSVPLGGFTVYNASFGYSAKHYDVALRVNNLTNKLYYGYVYTTGYTELSSSSSQGGENGVNNVYYPLAGVSALLTISFHL